MTNKTKMADVFELPVSIDADGDIYLGAGEYFYPSSPTLKPSLAIAAAHAINSIDRLTAENEALREEVERLRDQNQFYKVKYESNITSGEERDQLLSELDDAKGVANSMGDQYRKAAQEANQLKAVLQRFMELDIDDPDLKDDLWCLQQEEAPNDLSLARHDAEVIERFKSAALETCGLSVGCVQLSTSEAIHKTWIEFANHYANQLRQQAKP